MLCPASVASPAVVCPLVMVLFLIDVRLSLSNIRHLREKRRPWFGMNGLYLFVSASGGLSLLPAEDNCCCRYF